MTQQTNVETAGTCQAFFLSLRAIEETSARVLRRRKIQGRNPVGAILLDESARGNVLQADLKTLGVTDFGDPFPVKFRGYAGWPELFFDREPMRLARWPNEGHARVAKVLEQGSEPRYGEKPDRPGVFQYAGDRPERWLTADEVYLDGYWCYKWYNETIRVDKIDPEAKSPWRGGRSSTGLCASRPGR